MIRAVVFDMDGVLIDARQWHYEALNDALKMFGFEISYADHLKIFDGLPTKSKLQLLSNSAGLPLKLHSVISNIKQERTLRIAAFKCYPVSQHLILLAALKRANYKIGVATNSIHLTASEMLRAAGILDLLDTLVTNEDVQNPKPDPEIYLKACRNLGFKPNEVLVIEDNHHGIAAAKAAGCLVLEVKNPTEVHILNVNKILNGALLK
jgi:HAD superfamily hydrolase (TIGR01509 family)